MRNRPNKSLIKPKYSVKVAVGEPEVRLDIFGEVQHIIRVQWKEGMAFFNSDGELELGSLKNPKNIFIKEIRMDTSEDKLSANLF